MQVYRPKEGFVANPYLRLPRNMACPCSSGKKFKHCCLPQMPRFVPQSVITELRDHQNKEAEKEG